MVLNNTKIKDPEMIIYGRLLSYMLNRHEYVIILFVILSFVLICLHVWPCWLRLAVLVPQFVENIFIITFQFLVS